MSPKNTETFILQYQLTFSLSLYFVTMCFDTVHTFPLMCWVALWNRFTVKCVNRTTKWLCVTHSNMCACVHVRMSGRLTKTLKPGFAFIVQKTWNVTGEDLLRSRDSHIWALSFQFHEFHMLKCTAGITEDGFINLILWKSKENRKCCPFVWKSDHVYKPRSFSLSTPRKNI